LTYDPKKIIHVSRLKRVLHIDKAARKVIVEPNVPMDQLVAARLEYGLIPLVVPEVAGITVGGAFSGKAGESSSWKYGFFDRAVNWIEIILGDGQVVKAYSPEAKNVGIKESNKRHDLFLAVTGAFGTLGVTILFELHLQPATKYVEVTYHPVG
jgi:delta24-sterol reductase